MNDACFATRSANLFWKKVQCGTSDRCWPWLGHRNAKGYGIVSRRGKRLLAHRFAVDAAEGVVVRHRCDNPSCVNPAHLEIGTQADNLRDMRERGRDARGDRHPGAKLTLSKANELRRLYAAGVLSMSQLARNYGIGIRTVHAIVHGLRYKTDPIVVFKA